MDLRKEAHRLAELGISILPLRADGGKRPSILWKEFQERIMLPKEIEKFFKESTGIAAITGKISRLFLIDFDLDKSLPGQNYWQEYMSHIPEELKKKMVVNSTRSGGKHVWLRTDYEDHSRKLTRRFLTVPELMDRYEEALKIGADEYSASQALLNKPLECIIESRSRSSYGVIHHPSYTRFYGETFQEFSEEEVQFLINTCYLIDCEFTPIKRYAGETADIYSIIRKYNEDTNAAEVVSMLESSGVYTYATEDYNGNIKMKRAGSSNPYSGRVFIDSGIFSTFSTDTLFKGEKNNYTPFEVYCAVNNLTEYEAVEKIKENLNN